MTREEAIKALERADNYVGIHYINGVEDTYINPHLREAIKVALTALRPVSREQVEKMWRGCEKCNGAGEYSRYAENLTKILLAKYCPHCGRPLTDEAVQMVMERLEALKDGDLE